jgi:hypothetical protein
VSIEEAFKTGKGATDRIYYRIRCQEDGASYDMLCEIYFDQIQNVWVMERLID